MQSQTELAPTVNHLSPAFRCPAQVLVIDRPNGPANVLVDTVSLLLNQGISVVLVDQQDDALRALEFYDFDLVVVGVDARHLVDLSILAPVRVEHPAVPVLVVGRRLPHLLRDRARRLGADDVVELPERAADLKALVGQMAGAYLSPAWASCE